MKGDKKFMFTQNDNMKAIYSDDLKLLLQNIGCDEAFENSQLHCRYCNAIITKNNLYAMIPINESIEFCCNHSACIISLAEEAGV